MAKPRQITFQRLPAADGPKDDFGELSGEPVDGITCWAAYEPLGGDEFPASQKRHSETTARFRINYRSDINAKTVTATHQIAYIEDYDTDLVRTYDIKSVIVDRRRDFIIEVAETL